ncbi:MAG TPA: glycoside hydrolase family 3 N-terminal domain-containing protein [Thermomicrobiales bacterium]|nr:glycoside hydrolase family 3 N-terminal domain-containing protein [Thermomicrobiales bacterium]
MERRAMLRDKVARMIVSPVTGTSLSAEEADRLNALRPGGVILVGDNIETPDGIRPFTDAIREAVPERPPLLYVDQEGGVVRRIKTDDLPDQPAMANLPIAEVAEVAADRSAIVLDYGFDVNCAPVADVAFAPDSFMAGRSFGADPEAVADRVEATVTAMSAAGVIGAAKHFPGHGATSVDSHEALPTVELTRDQWLEGEAIPFQRAIAADVPMVMLGHLMYPNWPDWGDLPATINPVAYDALRDDLGYDGVIITDDLGMGALDAWDPFEIIDRAVDAGVDLILIVVQRAPVEAIADHLVDRIIDGTLDEVRIDESLARIDRLLGPVAG